MDAIRIQSKQKRKSDAGEGRKRGGKRRGRIYVRNAARGALLLLFLLGLALSLLPQGRGFARSALLLPALVSASEPPLLVASGEQVRHRQITVPSSNGTVYLDLYEPSGSTPALSAARGGILIVPGAGDNRQVPQLINLSRALARTGLVVMDMVTPTLMNYDLSAQDSDAVVQAFRALARQPGMEGRRIGMLAFSAGVPLTSFAAADERIRDQVAFMAVFGGYFQTESLLRAFGRRAIDIDGKTEHWQPTEVPIQVMGNMITQALPPAESERIKGALPPKGKPLTPGELAQFSTAGRAAYELLMGNAPAEVEQNIAALPPASHALLNELSPSRVLAQIRAPIFLLHDRNDASIPCTESRAFAAALQRLHHPYDYVEFHIFDHVEMRSHLEAGQLLGDGTRLLLLMSRLFANVS